MCWLMGIKSSLVGGVRGRGPALEGLDLICFLSVVFFLHFLHSVFFFILFCGAYTCLSVLCLHTQAARVLVFWRGRRKGALHLFSIESTQHAEETHKQQHQQKKPADLEPIYHFLLFEIFSSAMPKMREA